MVLPSGETAGENSSRGVLVSVTGFPPVRGTLAAGVPVTATRYLGTIHDFMLLNPIAQSLPTRAAIAQATAALRAALAYAPPL